MEKGKKKDIDINRAKWIETKNGNRISIEAIIKVPENILIKGRCCFHPNCKILTINNKNDGKHQGNQISMGEVVILAEDCALLCKSDNDSVQNKRIMKLGSFIYIGEGTELSNVLKLNDRIIVGKNCKIPNNCEVGSVVIIQDGIKLPNHYKIPSYSKVVGNHGKGTSGVTEDFMIQQLEPCFYALIENWCMQLYVGVPISIIRNEMSSYGVYM